MTLNSNEPGMVETSRVRESNATAAQPKVAHASDKPRPGRKGTHQKRTPETDDTAAIRDYWAAAKRHYQRGDYVDYGTPDWCALPIEDPRKMAGLVAFAELWRRYNPEIAEDFNRTLRAPHELTHRATTEACEAAFRSLANQRRKEAA
jgi:hypothetical protein